MTPKVRQSIYQLGTLVSGVLGILLIWGGLDQGSADSINQIVAGIVAMAGSAAPAVAATTVSKQIKNDIFNPKAPADSAVAAIKQTLDNLTQAQGDLDKVKQAAEDLGAGSLVQAVLSLGK